MRASSRRADPWSAAAQTHTPRQCGGSLAVCKRSRSARFICVHAHARPALMHELHEAVSDAAGQREGLPGGRGGGRGASAACWSHPARPSACSAPSGQLPAVR
eukprot:347276-Chlamydomonas_euryale.AAC.1